MVICAAPVRRFGICSCGACVSCVMLTLRGLEILATKVSSIRYVEWKAPGYCGPIETEHALTSSDENIEFSSKPQTSHTSLAKGEGY
jgi:hypothetical protein